MEEPKEVAEAAALFTDQFVDLDLFDQAPVRYSVPDAHGEKHAYELPTDVPFAESITFLRAHDAWVRAQHRLSQAKSTKAQDNLLDSCADAWTRLIGAFSAIIQIRQPEFDSEELNGFGENVLGNWMMTVVTRLQLARIGPDLTAVMASISSGETAENPKAARS